MILTRDNEVPFDYKFHCFNGVPDNVMVCTDRYTGNTKFYYFNQEWDLLKYNGNGINPTKDFSLPKTGKLDEMFEVAKILSKDIPYLRVDLYYEDDRIYFGELTLYPCAGFDSGLLEQTDLLFGNKLCLKTSNLSTVRPCSETYQE